MEDIWLRHCGLSSRRISPLVFDRTQNNQALHVAAGSAAVPRSAAGCRQTDFARALIISRQRDRTLVDTFGTYRIATVLGADPIHLCSSSSVRAQSRLVKPVRMGLALGTNEQGNFLFATNFFSGKVDVLDKDFKSAAALFPASAFQDPAIPAGYAPFGI